MVHRTPGICTVTVYAHSGLVQTVTSTCLSLLWNGCNMRPPAGHQGNSSSQRKVSNQEILAIASLFLCTLFARSLLCFLSESVDVTPSSSMSSLTRVYHCDVCDKDLTLTSTEILKHKRQHLYSAK